MTRRARVRRSNLITTIPAVPVALTRGVPATGKPRVDNIKPRVRRVILPARRAPALDRATVSRARLASITSLALYPGAGACSARRTATAGMVKAARPINASAVTLPVPRALERVPARARAVRVESTERVSRRVLVQRATLHARRALVLDRATVSRARLASIASLA